MGKWKGFVLTDDQPPNISFEYRGIAYSNVNAYEVCLDVLSMLGYTQAQMFQLLKEIKIEDGGAIYNLRRRVR